MNGWRSTALMIAPSGGLAWGVAFWYAGPTSTAVGVVSGIAVGILGAWLLTRQLERADAGSPAGWASAGLMLLMLFVALIVVPSFLSAGMRNGWPRGLAP